MTLSLFSVAFLGFYNNIDFGLPALFGCIGGIIIVNWERNYFRIKKLTTIIVVFIVSCLSSYILLILLIYFRTGNKANIRENNGDVLSRVQPIPIGKA